MNNQKVWYVTGASKGLGLTLVKKLLNEGYRVAATSRNLNQLIAAVNITSDNFLPLQVDLANEESVKASIEKTIALFKSVNIVVNNAGYGISGAIEELTDKETRDHLDVNVFGTLNVIRHVMPYLRQQQSGYIMNISSVAGFSGSIGSSIYAASKFAVVGLSEVLAEDVKEFGVKVTVILPGGFRTNFLTADSLVQAKKKIAAYSAITAAQIAKKTQNGKQMGSPEKAADLFIELSKMENPPLRLFIGSDAEERAEKKVAILTKELKELSPLSVSTDY